MSASDPKPPAPYYSDAGFAALWAWIKRQPQQKAGEWKPDPVACTSGHSGHDVAKRKALLCNTADTAKRTSAI